MTTLCRRIVLGILGIITLSGPAVLAAEAPSAAQHRLHRGGRPGLWRPGLLWPEEDQDAERRCASGRGDALHAALFRQSGVCAVAVRAHDRQAYRPCHRSHQPEYAAGRAVSPAARYRHAGQASPGPWLRHRGVRQVGAGRTGLDRRRFCGTP